MDLMIVIINTRQEKPGERNVFEVVLSIRFMKSPGSITSLEIRAILCVPILGI